MSNKLATTVGNKKYLKTRKLIVEIKNIRKIESLEKTNFFDKTSTTDVEVTMIVPKSFANFDYENIILDSFSGPNQEENASKLISNIFEILCFDQEEKINE